ncbi:MAG: glycoside hydrolase family 31 protein [Saccharofermentanales bacterium]
MNYSMTIGFLENEHWWGGAIVDGLAMPFCAGSHHKRELDHNNTYNQAAPFLLSDKGRFIWCEFAFEFIIDDNNIILTGSKGRPQIFEGYGDLRGAFLEAGRRFFPASEKAPPEEFFNGIQYNTWIELAYDQNQAGILDYARKIKETGMPSTGIIMIDCGWNEYNGRYEFSLAKFSDPKAMIDELHDLGFKVMLWNCPFISADTPEYRFARDNNLLVRDRSGNPSIKQWWDGFSAVLDFTNPQAAGWYEKQNRRLMDLYGVDGFKFDAGDAHFYSDDDVTFLPTDSNGQSEAWAMFGLSFDFNEFRASWKCGGQAIVQRLGDKDHAWSDNGMYCLVPSLLAQGIIGMPYTCPDMIGGGQYFDFIKKTDCLDQELFVRYAQCAALMPMMQFSAAPWRVLDERHFNLCKEAAWIHMEYAPLILELVENAKITGEPVIRYMEYVFPGQGLEKMIDQFMLGNDTLVAPVFHKGVQKRDVAFPEGIWVDRNGDAVTGGRTVTVDAPLEVLPIFRRMKQE